MHTKGIDWKAAGGSVPEAACMRSKANGFTILELMVAMAVTVGLFVFLGMITTAQTRAVDTGVNSLLAHSECDRAVLEVVEDLQTTNTVEDDQAGVAYFSVSDTQTGEGERIQFRRVEGFAINVDEDNVTPTYGSSVTYSVNDQEQLVRTQAGETKVLANRVQTCEFSVSGSGTITFHIVTYAGSGAEREEFESTISVTPRNGYDR